MYQLPLIRKFTKGVFGSNGEGKCIHENVNLVYFEIKLHKKY